MLTSTSFSNNAGFAHALGQQNLTQHVIRLVAARMIKFISLKIDFGTAEVCSQPLCKVEGTWASNVVCKVVVHKAQKFGIFPSVMVGLLYL